MAFGILVDIGKSNTAFESDLVSIDLDVTQDEVHEWSNDVTQFPVETGSPISDHIHPLPDRVTISGIISNSALGETALTELNNGDDRVQTAFDALLKLKEDRILVTVYTRLKIYDDMAIKSCNIPRDSSVGDSVKFKIEFVHVRIVDTQTVDVPQGISKKLDKKQGGKSGATGKATAPQKANGKTEAKPVDPDKSAAKVQLDKLKALVNK